MDKISTIKQNILLFIENQGFRKEDFFNKIDISYSNFKGKSLYSEIGADKLVKILTCFPQINPEWLITGNGQMLKETEQKPYVENNAAIQFNEPKETIEVISAQKKTIEILEREVADLRNDKDFLKHIIDHKLGKDKSA